MTARSKAPENPAAEQTAECRHVWGPYKCLNCGQPSPGAEQAAANPVEQPNMLLCPPLAKPKRQRDPELVAMEQLTRIFEAMPEYCKRRVISWLTAKYGGGPQGEVPPQTWTLPPVPARP